MCTRFANGFKTHQISIEVNNFNQCSSSYLSSQNYENKSENVGTVMQVCYLIWNYDIDSRAFYNKPYLLATVIVFDSI